MHVALRSRCVAVRMHSRKIERVLLSRGLSDRIDDIRRKKLLKEPHQITTVDKDLKDIEETSLTTDEPSSDAVFTIPNIITMGRLLATPAISYLLLTDKWDMALLSLTAAGASDWLDGYIARTYNQTSVLGSILDPLADKALVAAVAIPLAVGGHLPSWLVVLMLARDVGLVAGVMFMRSGVVPAEELGQLKKMKKIPGHIRRIKSRADLPPIDPAAPFELFEVRPTYLSKANTALQVGLLGTTLTSLVWGFPSEIVTDALIYTVATTTVVSGADYAHSARKQILAASSTKES